MADNYEVTNNEIMDFLKENMVMKEELREELKKFVTKEDLQREFGKFKLEMNDMMDDKLADLKGDFVLLTRKGDKKLLCLVGILKRKNFLTDDEVRELITMDPFPQIAL